MTRISEQEAILGVDFQYLNESSKKVEEMIQLETLPPGLLEKVYERLNSFITTCGYPSDKQPEDLNSVVLFKCLEAVNESILNNFDIKRGDLRITTQVDLKCKDKKDKKYGGKTDYSVIRITQPPKSQPADHFYLSAKKKKSGSAPAKFQCGAYLKGMAEIEKSKPVSIFCYFSQKFSLNFV